VFMSHLLVQWGSPKPPKPDPDSPNDLQRRGGASNGLMSAAHHQQHHPLNHHHHPQQQQQAATSSSSRLGLPGGTTDSAVPGYQQQVPGGGVGVDGCHYPPSRPMCAGGTAAVSYNGGSTPTAAHQGPPSLPAAGGYSPVHAFGGSRGHGASATPGHAALGGPTAHAAAAAASYCMPMG